MNKFIASILSLLLLSSCGVGSDILSLPDKHTMAWRTVEVEGVGSFRVPTEWCIEQEGNALYITDKPRESEDYTIHLVGTIQTYIYGAESVNIEPHELLVGVEKGDILLSPVYSNSVRLYSIEYIIQDTKEELYLISLSTYNGNDFMRFELLAWNREVVTDEIAINIAKTFEMER